MTSIPMHVLYVYQHQVIGVNGLHFIQVIQFQPTLKLSVELDHMSNKLIGLMMWACNYTSQITVCWCKCRHTTYQFIGMHISTA